MAPGAWTTGESTDWACIVVCTQNKAKRKELYQNVVYSILIQLVFYPPFLYILKSTIVYKVLITSN